MEKFVHLHVHTQYSLLDGQTPIDGLIDKAYNDGMRAVAITDHGNMFGVKEFFNKIKKKNSKHKGIIKDCKSELQQLMDKSNSTPEDDERIAKLSYKIKEEEAQLFKPLIGCECYCARNSRFQQQGEENKSGWHLILIAKTKQGYNNLIKMVSRSYTEGFYSKPRIDKELLEKYHEGIIVSSACLAGEIPRLIQNGEMAKAEKSILWFKKIFGDDYYLELQRLKNNNPDDDVYPRQKEVNRILLELARKLDVKLIATNDVHFLNREDATAHDILLCVSTNKNLNDVNRLRYTQQEWFKTTAEMNELFGDVPEALANTVEIADKVEFYDIDSSALMPFFEIDPAFATEEAYRRRYDEQALIDEFTRKDYDRLGGYDKALRIKLEADYLSYLTYRKAVERYGEELSDELRERIDFELNTMKHMGFPGYFLIVQDFINAARLKGVAVGPGRGSAAGSVVAYCLGITDIDPLKYDLLFERFLNPDRISMPDIDIDFDDDGRADALKYVTDKYGYDRVSHIITYGTMGAKSAIKDVARVIGLPLAEANRLAKLVPDRIDVKSGQLNYCYKNTAAFKDDLKNGSDMVKQTLLYAAQLEGTVRNIGVHACGIIIGRQDISDVVPICTVYDKESGERQLVTQYEGAVIEETGLIKMDFLGLKTLSIIKEALANIKMTTGKEVDIAKLPLDDEKTYQLYCQGRTTATFQFESANMQKYLKELQPSRFEDLIAMNALYRPGPMDYIPDFIARKQGRQAIVYDIPEMEAELKETYGITVYQEQVMRLARQLAGFTQGESDSLRKAMGKKMKDKMAEYKEKFCNGGEKRGHPRPKLEKIWGDWEKFAEYAFNKSHATCYSWVAYQTAYLKAHYPSEYMAAVLSRNLSDIKEITKSMDECKALGLKVLGPDVNESYRKFGVNSKGEIRFGLVAVKGVGEGAVQNIIEEREKNGPYKSIYDFIERVNVVGGIRNNDSGSNDAAARAIAPQINKRVIESLALAGAFDALGVNREPFIEPNSKGETFTEVLLRYGISFQQDRNNTAASLFGDADTSTIAKPQQHHCPAWSDLVRLNKEKELIGIYLSAHPLDDYRLILEHCCNCGMADLKDAPADKELVMGGIVSNVRESVTQAGKNYAVATIEDFTGSGEIALFNKDYESFGAYMRLGAYLFIRAVKERSFKAGGDYFLKIRKISLLQKEKNNLLQRITIPLSINELNDSLIDELKTALSQCNAGSTALYFAITDDEQRSLVLNLTTRGGGIELTPSLMRSIENIEILPNKNGKGFINATEDDDEDDDETTVTELALDGDETDGDSDSAGSGDADVRKTRRLKIIIN